jgi:hypothetical protein
MQDHVRKKLRKNLNGLSSCLRFFSVAYDLSFCLFPFSFSFITTRDFVFLGVIKRAPSGSLDLTSTSTFNVISMTMNAPSFLQNLREQRCVAFCSPCHPASAVPCSRSSVASARPQESAQKVVRISVGALAEVVESDDEICSNACVIAEFYQRFWISTVHCSKSTDRCVHQRAN